MKKEIPAICLLIVLLIASKFSFALDTQATFDSANAAYDTQDYELATEEYESILNEGFESLWLYYNLGNTYYKRGKFAKAILNFERALKIDPSNEDVLFNLKLTNLRTADRVEPIKPLLLTKIWKNIIEFNSANSWSILGALCLWLFFTCLGLIIITASIQVRRITFLLALVFFSSTIFLTIATYQQYQNEQQRSFGIVYAESVYVKSAPDESSIDLFIVHEGLKIEVIDQLNIWRKIKLKDGNQGWVIKRDLLII